MLLPDFLKLGSVIPARNPACSDGELLVFGKAQLGLPSSMLDFTTVESPLSLQCLAQLGLAMSVLDLLHLGFSLSVRSHAQLDFVVFIPDHGHLDFPPFARSFGCFGSLFLLPDLIEIGSLSSLRGLSHCGSTQSTMAFFAIGSAIPIRLLAELE